MLMAHIGAPQTSLQNSVCHPTLALDNLLWEISHTFACPAVPLGTASVGLVWDARGCHLAAIFSTLTTDLHFVH